MSGLLDTLYIELDFQNGSLLTVSDEPCSNLNVEDWLEKGEWLAAAKRAKAEKLFFVGNNPVAVFAECGSGDLEKERAFNRIWCLGRPRLLFLASPGEISVLDLAQKPINSAENIKNISEPAKLTILETVIKVEEVARELQAFHRDRIESGLVFGDHRFGGIENRADKALIRDLKIVRGELIEAGLSGDKLRYAHTLIGRSIFIRYLEDRDILKKDYFLEIADKNQKWINILDKPSERFGFDISEGCSFYSRILSDKDFTYALFRTLARDFNGDMFPDIDEEEKNVTLNHLYRIQGLLYGVVGIQRHLFFYSYRFDIVPLELISSIYEEFYHPSADSAERQSKARSDGAFYTPPALAELTASRVLTKAELEKRPRVLDPACGSGIFLVEAFRRIVRYEWYMHEKRPDFNSLKKILKDQIAGIEVNEEAAGIAAFSLCLALLHYLFPPDINKHIKRGNKLPTLLASENDAKDDFHSIWVGNTFGSASPFCNGCADIIVSNPPWGSLGRAADDETKKRNAVVLKWCEENRKTIGDKEASQAFLWKYHDMLTDGGEAAVLVPAGVLLKNRKTTQVFRKQWMNLANIKEVLNFSHVRKHFFKDAVSPFVLMVFEKGENQNLPVIYRSAKRVKALEQTQAVLLTKYDMHLLRDEDLASNEVWKTYWFGRLQDRRFIKWLQTKIRLEEYMDHNNSGGGYQLPAKGHKTENAEELQSFKSLKKLKSRYEKPVLTAPPANVHRFGKVGAYQGMRILVNEGINQESRPQGTIIAQFSDVPFCFSESFYGIKLKEQTVENYRLFTGILWSSLAQYYFFMTSANWGQWHDKLLLGELCRLPVIFEKNNPAASNIIDIVGKLQDYDPPVKDLMNPDGEDEKKIKARRKSWEHELNEAVFELYDLSEEQKDLVRDFCEITLPFYY